MAGRDCFRHIRYRGHALYDRLVFASMTDINVVNAASYIESYLEQQ